MKFLLLVKPISLLKNAWMWLFGFDLFISYKQSDARNYVNALAKELSEKHKLEIYVDHLHAPGGVAVRQDIRRNGLKRSQALLVVASPNGIAQDEEITNEIVEFHRIHPKRRLMAIEFDHKLDELNQSHSWATYFKKSDKQPLWHREIAGAAALIKGKPSTEAIDYIVKSKSRIRRRLIAQWTGRIASLAIVVLGISASIFLYQYIDSIVENQAISKGFEALDRSDYRSAKALVLAKESLETRDNYAARRVLMTLWAEEPNLSKIGFEKTYNIKSFSHLQIASSKSLPTNLVVSDGWQVRRFNSDFNQIHTDVFDWQRVYNSIEFAPKDVEIDSSGSIAIFGTLSGKVTSNDLYTGQLPSNDNKPTELRCLTRFKSESSFTDFEFDWIRPPITGPIIKSSPWLITKLANDNPVLWNPKTQKAISIPITKPRIFSSLDRVTASNCLIAGGRDWTDSEEASLSAIDINLDKDNSIGTSSKALGLNGVFGTNKRNFSVLRHTSLKEFGGGLLAVGTKHITRKEVGAKTEYLYFVELLRLDTLQRIGRIKTLSHSFLRLLAPFPKTSSAVINNPSLLVIGHQNGSLQGYDLLNLVKKNVTTPLFQAFIQDRQPFNNDENHFNTDKARWKNFQTPHAVFRTAANRVAWIDKDSQLAEIKFPSEKVRFGRRITEKEAKKVQLPQERYETVQGPLPWGLGTILPIDILEWTVNDSEREIQLGPPSWFKRQEGRWQPIVDPDGGSIWYIEPNLKGKPLVYQTFGFSGFEDPIDIKYWVNNPLIFDKKRKDIIALSGRELTRLNINKAKQDFWKTAGPSLNIPLSGDAQTAALIPNTPFIFIVVRLGNELGFELVDLDRNLSLSRMVVLGIVPDEDFIWPSGEKCEEDITGVKTCPVDLKIDPTTFLATISYGGREQFEVPLSVDSWLADIEKTLRWSATGELARELGVKESTGVPLKEESKAQTIVEPCTDEHIYNPETWPKPSRQELETLFPIGLAACPVTKTSSSKKLSVKSKYSTITIRKEP